MSGKSKIEICANSVESAVKAQEGGAYRVELCAGIPEGGTTPSFGEIRMARQLLQQTKLHVIIRPRGGDFLYTQLEQEIMLHDIKVARQLGADGVVFGCLTAEGNVDVEFVAVFIPGRVVADFLALFVLPHNLSFIILDIELAGSDIFKADNIRVVLNIIRSTRYDEFRRTSVFFHNEHFVVFAERLCRTEAVLQFLRIRLTVGKLFFDLRNG